MVSSSPVQPPLPVLAALEQRRRVMMTARSLEWWTQLVGTSTKLLAIVGMFVAAGMLFIGSIRVSIASIVVVLLVTAYAWILGRLVDGVGEAFRLAAEVDDAACLVVALRSASRYSLLVFGVWVVLQCVAVVSFAGVKS